MVVQINFEHDGTETIGDGRGGFIILENPEKDESYASWPFHAEPDEHHLSGDTNVWKWENPDEQLENITLSPSLKLEWDAPNTFHIFVRDGNIEHCSDCMCGCGNGV